MSALSQLMELLPSIENEIRNLTDTNFKNVPDTTHCLAPQLRGDVRLVASGLASALEELDASISRLKSSRTSMAKSHLSHSTLLAPISSLPTEILSSIFRRALSPIHLHDPNPILKACRIANRTKTAIRIALVCKLWRQIAVAIPWLWNIIGLDWPPKKDQGLTLELLSRSRPLPTSLFLSINEADVPSFSRHCSRALFAPFRDSCQVIEILRDEFTEPMNAVPLLDILADWPHLMQLSLPSSRIAVQTISTRLLSNVRRLQIFPRGEDALAFFTLRWDRLEALVLLVVELACVDMALLPRNFPRLEHLFVYAIELCIIPCPLGPVTLPKLRVLGLQATPVQDARPASLEEVDGGEAAFLDSITLPELVALSVPIHSTEQLEIVDGLFERSNRRPAALVLLINYKQWTVTRKEVEKRYAGMKVNTRGDLLGSPLLEACRKIWYGKFHDV